jgi:ankyrin repeat protein
MDRLLSPVVALFLLGLLASCQSPAPHSRITVDISTADQQAATVAMAPLVDILRDGHPTSREAFAARLSIFVEQFGVGARDALGLDLVQRAAALGRVDVLPDLQAAGFLLVSDNPRTGMNTLHYAAQSLGGGSEVLNWLLDSAATPREALAALNQRVPSNGHTVVMEAVFNGNTRVVRDLISRSSQGVQIDFDSPNATGFSPKSFARRERMVFWQELPDSRIVPLVTNPESDDWLTRQNVVRNAWLAEQDQAWLAALPLEQQSAQALGQRFLAAVSRGDLVEVQRLVADHAIDINGRYGRLGATALNSLSTAGMSPESLQKALAVQDWLLLQGADPLQAETGLMQVSAGFREAVFGYASLLDAWIQFFSGSSTRQTFLNVQGPMNGYTKLIDAALRGRVTVLQSLLAAGADTSLFGHNNMTAYAAALQFNSQHPSDGLAIPASLLEDLKPIR